MKKLLIITGAGASLEFGMPSVKEIDLLIEGWAREILPLKDFPDKSLYTWVKERLHDYASKNTNNRIGNIMSFENLLYTIQSISAISTDLEYKSFNNTLNPFIEIEGFPAIIYFGNEKKASGDDFAFLHKSIVDKLLEHFRNKCKTLDIDKPNELQELKCFFNSLKEDFEIGFINLNYDNVILSAIPDLTTGFDTLTGEFKREDLYSFKWNFCYHLHGSVHFDMRKDENGQAHQIFWNNDLTSRFSGNSSGRNPNTTSEGLGHLNSSIIVGLDKANQILKQPFNQYFMQLDRLVYESDAILFMGYGFADLHLNSIFPFIRYDPIKKRKVVIIDFAPIDGDGITFRHDGWQFGVFKSLPYNARDFGKGFSEPHGAGYFKKRKILEKSLNPDLPMAIWYDGILEACKHTEIIKAELK